MLSVSSAETIRGGAAIGPEPCVRLPVTNASSWEPIYEGGNPEIFGMSGPLPGLPWQLAQSARSTFALPAATFRGSTLWASRLAGCMEKYCAISLGPHLVVEVPGGLRFEKRNGRHDVSRPVAQQAKLSFLLPRLRVSSPERLLAVWPGRGALHRKDRSRQGTDDNQSCRRPHSALPWQRELVIPLLLLSLNRLVGSVSVYRSGGSSRDRRSSSARRRGRP